MAKNIICNVFDDASVEYRTGTAQPSAGAGVEAPRGSRYIRTGGAGGLWLKTGTGDTNWEEIGNEAIEDEVKLASDTAGITLNFSGNSGYLYRLTAYLIQDQAGVANPWDSALWLRWNDTYGTSNSCQAGQDKRVGSTGAGSNAHQIVVHQIVNATKYYYAVDAWIWTATTFDSNNSYVMIFDRTTLMVDGVAAMQAQPGASGGMYNTRSSELTSIVFRVYNSATNTDEKQFLAGSWATLSRVIGFDFQ